jgi:hypothetical protein
MKQKHTLKLTLVDPELLGKFERDTGLELWYSDCAKLCWADIEVPSNEALDDYLRLINLHPAIRLAWLGSVNGDERP